MGTRACHLPTVKSYHLHTEKILNIWNDQNNWPLKLLTWPIVFNSLLVSKGAHGMIIALIIDQLPDIIRPHMPGMDLEILL